MVFGSHQTVFERLQMVFGKFKIVFGKFKMVFGKFEMVYNTYIKDASLCPTVAMQPLLSFLCFAMKKSKEVFFNKGISPRRAWRNEMQSKVRLSANGINRALNFL